VLRIKTNADDRGSKGSTANNILCFAVKRLIRIPSNAKQIYIWSMTKVLE